VEVYETDVCDGKRLDATLHEVRSKQGLFYLFILFYFFVSNILGGKIVGVFHLAGIIDDCLLDQLDAKRFLRVCGPKIEGGWNLHNSALQDKEYLQYFVLFSSVAAILGMPGQVYKYFSKCWYCLIFSMG
jgi:hypothetical protein